MNGVGENIMSGTPYQEASEQFVVAEQRAVPAGRVVCINRLRWAISLPFALCPMEHNILWSTFLIL